jgi:hypothetical protein
MHQGSPYRYCLHGLEGALVGINSQCTLSRTEYADVKVAGVLAEMKERPGAHRDIIALARSQLGTTPRQLQPQPARASTTGRCAQAESQGSVART